MAKRNSNGGAFFADVVDILQPWLEELVHEHGADLALRVPILQETMLTARWAMGQKWFPRIVSALAGKINLTRMPGIVGREDEVKRRVVAKLVDELINRLGPSFADRLGKMSDDEVVAALENGLVAQGARWAAAQLGIEARGEGTMKSNAMVDRENREVYHPRCPSIPRTIEARTDHPERVQVVVDTVARAMHDPSCTGFARKVAETVEGSVSSQAVVDTAARVAHHPNCVRIPHKKSETVEGSVSSQAVVDTAARVAHHANCVRYERKVAEEVVGAVKVRVIVDVEQRFGFHPACASGEIPPAQVPNQNRQGGRGPQQVRNQNRQDVSYEQFRAQGGSMHADCCDALFEREVAAVTRTRQVDNPALTRMPLADARGQGMAECAECKALFEAEKVASARTRQVDNPNLQNMSLADARGQGMGVLGCCQAVLADKVAGTGETRQVPNTGLQEMPFEAALALGWRLHNDGDRCCQRLFGAEQRPAGGAGTVGVGTVMTLSEFIAALGDLEGNRWAEWVWNDLNDEDRALVVRLIRTGRLTPDEGTRILAYQPGHRMNMVRTLDEPVRPGPIERVERAIHSNTDPAETRQVVVNQGRAVAAWIARF